MNKRLAIVNHNLGSGGAEKLIHDMALELKDMNIEFSIILLTNVNDIYGKKLQEVGIDVIYLSNKWDIYSPKNIFKLKKILKHYDIIHTHTYTAQLWTAFSSLFLGKKKKYITTEHSTSNRRREKFYFKYLDGWMYSRYNKIISITDATQINLKKWLNNKNPEKHLVINNGINLKKYYSTTPINRKEINQNLKEEDILICMIGRFSEQKSKNFNKKYEIFK
ncbi:glycosyltransferase [Cetobacterium somerae]|uniref:glycosyltransferase n=1 Tax=Cetobacterium somerae TaxID=188913 RepID=UPI003892AD8A